MAQEKEKGKEKRTIRVQPLSLAAFGKYGRYANFAYPPGINTFGTGSAIEFSPDMISLDTGGKVPSFSDCSVKKRPFIITETEAHSETEELYRADEDTIIHVGPPTADDNPPLDAIEAFFVPARTVVVFKRRVWHHAGYKVVDSDNPTTILIGLAPCTYHNDCHLVRLAEADQIEIDTGM
ncbi:MAG: ureidoglycolate lyase [Patescibacteria group bacterium]